MGKEKLQLINNKPLKPINTFATQEQVLEYIASVRICYGFC
jgi:hypothetical protein